MIRRVLLPVLLLIFSFTQVEAGRSRCDLGGTCAAEQPLPDFGPDLNPEVPPGGGPPVFYLRDQEPYRNPDKGPLGVILSTGEFQLTVTDLEIPGRGFPFRLTRTYRSRKDGEKSLLGYNWTLNLDEYLTPGVFTADGHTYPAIQWKLGNGFSDVWVGYPNETGYRPFQGFFGKLRTLGPGQGYQIRTPDGTVKTFGRQVVDNDGHLIWMLTRIEDRAGNAMTLQISPAGVVGSVTDTLGRVIQLGYTPEGRLASVTDFAGRRVVYAYDTRGDLVSVRSPVVVGTPNGNDFPAGKITSYRYLGAAGCAEEALRHNLQAITDARGQTFLVNAYTSLADPLCGTPGLPADTVASQEYGGGVPAPRIQYTYGPVPAGSLPDANVVTTQATVIDRAGNVQIHRFNPQGNPLSIEYHTNRGIRSFAGGIDEPDYVVRNVYVVDDRGNQPMLVSRRTSSGGLTIDPGGSLTSYAEGVTEEYVYYDQQGLSAHPDIFRKGNVERIIRTPGSRGAPADQAQQVTEFEYEPLFSQAIRVRDPRGHATRMTYDFQERAYADLIAGPLPAAIDTSWWSNGEISSWMSLPGNSSLGDVNGDGSVYSRRGSLLRTEEEGAVLAADGVPSGSMATQMRYNPFGLLTVQVDAEGSETHLAYFSERDPDGDGAVSPPPPDGRSLGAAIGSNGGGYLESKVLDAIPSPPRASPVPANVLLAFTYDRAGNVTSSIDGRGIRTDFSVNALNQVVQIRHAAAAPAGLIAFGYLEQFDFDANNNLVRRRIEQRDDSGQAPGQGRWITTEAAYDALDHKIRETVTTADAIPLTVSTRFEYDPNGNLVKTVSPAGNVVLRRYDERDLLFQEAALKQCVEPSAVSSICNSFDPQVDSVTQIDYDGSGEIIQAADPEGHVSRSAYDGYGRIVAAFDPAWQRTTFEYDAGDNLLTRVTYGTLGGATPSPAAPPPLGYPELARQNNYFDELGRLRRTDRRFFRYFGATLTPLATDGNAGLTTVPPGDPLPAAGDGWVTRLVFYDRLGRTVRAVDDKGHASEVRYDGLGRKVKVLMTAAAPFVFDPMHPDEGRNSVEYAYDGGNNLIEMIETEVGADRSGGTARLLPPQQHLSRYKFDALDRRIETRLVGRVGAAPVDLVSTVLYDSRGHAIQQTDAAGGRTKLFFDGLGRLTRTESGYLWNGTLETIPPNLINAANPDGRITTRYTYDLNSRMTSVQDDNSRLTSYGYDALNRQVRITYPDGSTRLARFDRDSLPISDEQRNPQGYRLSVATSYDGLHRPTLKEVDSSAAPWVKGTGSQAFQYDGLGRITLARDDADPADGFIDSEVSLAYDSLGDVLREMQLWRSNESGSLATGVNLVNSTYDGTGFRTQVTYPGGRIVSFLPDELNRPERIVDSYTGTTTYDFLGAGRLLNRIHPNGTRLTLLSGATDTVGRGYDDARRIVDFASRLDSTGQDLVRYAYGYDRAGNRTFERRIHEPSGSGWKGESFTYDAAYRLISRREGILAETGSPVGAAASTQEYTLDGAGNWRSRKENAATYNQAVNSLNQYTRFNGPSGARSLYYNFLGNLEAESISSDETRQYGYDFLNRLVTVLGGFYSETRYRYDALGRRISKSVNGDATRFVYDGDRLIEERDGENRLTESYLFGSGSDEILSRRRFTAGLSSDIFYHTNALGSVTAVTDGFGQVVERYRYDTYGQVTFLSPTGTPLTGSAVLNNVLFTGRYLDIESGLYFFRARTYHPYLGRFLQRDPLGEAFSLNLYSYVFNNPVNHVDPTGMACMTPEQRADTEWAHEALKAGIGREGANAMADYDMGVVTGAQGRDMEAAYQAGVAKLSAEGWARRDARRQAKVLVKLKAELESQMDDPENQKALQNLKGIKINTLGFAQNAAAEAAGKDDKSELDTKSADDRLAGNLTLTLTSKYMMKPGHFGEVSQEALDMVADVVQGAADTLCGNVPVEVNGFSRGAGPAVGLTNTLTGDGYNLPGENVTLNLIDGYMSPKWNQVTNADVTINSFLSTSHDLKSMVIGWGASLLGVGRQNVVPQDHGAVNMYYLRVSHTQMDTYVPGALGMAPFLGY